MAYTTQINCPIYDGDGYPQNNWLVCEVFWEANIFLDKNRKLTMFIGGLRDRALSWYINFIENGWKRKQEIKKKFLESFWMQYNKKLDPQDIKAIAQRVG